MKDGDKQFIDWVIILYVTYKMEINSVNILKTKSTLAFGLRIQLYR